MRTRLRKSRISVALACLLLCFCLLGTKTIFGVDADQSGRNADGNQQAEQSSANRPSIADGKTLSPDWRFQRQLVPADHPETWPREKTERYLPMAADEFGHRIAVLRGESESGDSNSGAQLIHAEYTGQLNSRSVMEGEATWQFVRIGTDKSVVVLKDCELPMDGFQWGDASQPAGNGMLPAVVGNDQYGRLAAVIDRAGKIRSHWALRGQQFENGELVFKLRFAACQTSTLHLTLPADLEPVVDNALVSVENRTPAGQRQWEIDLGGVHETSLRIVKRAAIDKNAAIPIYRAAFNYKLSEHGLECEAEIRIAAGGVQLDKLQIVADHSLSIVAIKQGDAQWPFVPAELANGAKPAQAAPSDHPDIGKVRPEKPNVYLVSMPSVRPVNEIVLRVSAIAPIPNNARFHLPTVQLAGMNFESAAARVVVSAPFVLDELITHDCCQTGCQSLGEPNSGEAIELQFFNDRPQVELAISEHEHRLQVAQGTSIAVHANEIAGHCRADLTADGREQFSINADVAPQWIIDGVESTPPGMVADWTQKSAPGRPGKLALQLAEPLLSPDCLHLEITGHRRRGGDALHVDDLSMLKFTDAKTFRRVVQLQLSETLQFQLRGAEDLTRLDPAKLQPTDAALLDPKAAGLMFVDNPSARGLGITLSAKTPLYDGDVHLDAAIADNKLTESYRFRISPQGREVARLRLRFSQSRAEAFNWALEGEPKVALSARRLSESELTTSGLAGGEIWEVDLPTPRSAEFTITGSRSVPFQDDTPVALASLIDAEAQQGTVEVRAIGRNLPEIRVRRLAAVPVSPPAVGQYSTALVALRYLPEEDALQTAEPPLVVAPHELAATDRAWIWQAELESRYHRQGAEHQLTCRIENTGRARFQIQPPPGATFRGAWIDDQPVVVAANGAEPWRINLPVGARFATLVIRWSDDRSTLATVSSIAPPWPTCDLAILASRWKVWIPPDTFIASADLDGARAIDVSWSRRLLAPLAEILTPTTGNAVEQFSAVADTDSSANSRHSSAVAAPKLPQIAVAVASPWKSTDRSVSSSNHGWSTIELAGATDRGTQISIVCRQPLLVWGWSLLLCTIAARFWYGRRNTAIDLAVFAAITAFALIVPAAWTILVGSLWLGFVVGCLMAYLQPYFDIPRVPGALKSESGFETGKLTVVAGVLLVAICVWQRWAQADEPSAHNSLPLYRILVPVDSNQHPTGGLYYLPETFHDVLIRDSSAQALEPPEYLICRADYSAFPEGNAEGNAATSGVWTARFEIESLSDRAHFQVPLGFAGSMLVPDGVTVDGKTATMQSLDARPMGTIELAGQGKHRVEIQFRPVRSGNRIEFAIPKVASAQISLPNGSGSTPKLTSEFADEMPLGVGTVATEEGAPSGSAAESTQKTQTNQTKFWLGPADRIALSFAVAWPNPPIAATDRPPMFDADQLTWFHVRRNSVEAELRLHVKVQSGRLTALRLAIDPRWRPVRISESSIVGAELHRVDDAGVATIEFAAPVMNSATVDVAFELPEASGIGQWRLNCATVMEAQNVRRWCAMNVDPPRVFRESLQVGAKIIPISQFLQQWRPRIAVETKPQLTWQPAAAGQADSVATWPNDPHFFARYQFALTAGLNETALQFIAEIASTDQPVYQYRIQVPPELVVDHVVVRNQKAVVPSHWSPSEPGILTVFLTVPATDSLQLQIDGRIRHAASAKLLIPVIRIEHAQSEGSRALVLRRSDVLVDVVEAAGAQAAAPADAAAAVADVVKRKLSEASGQANPDFVAAYFNSGDPQPLTLKIEPNHPIVQSMQATTLSRSADAWLASVDVELQIERGIVDTLRFDLPPNWTGPFEVSPAMAQTVEEVPGENRRQLVLRPASGLVQSAGELSQMTDLNRGPIAVDDSGNVHLRITGPLTVTAGQRPSAPDIHLEEASRQTRYFLLPRRLENQQLSWDIRQLNFTPTLPENLLKYVSDINSYRIYQLQGDRSRASLRSVDGRAGNMQVRQADIAMHWEIGGQYYGAAGYDIEPAGSTACELQIPANSQLIDARLDGAAAQLSPLGENRWSLWLGLNKLPRRLEVVYVGRLREGSQRQMQFHAPSLVGLPVERTLWMVSAPAAAGPGQPSPGSNVSQLRHHLVRFQGAASLADSAAGLLVDESADDGARWYTQWLRRFKAYQDGVMESHSTATDDAERQSVQADAAAVDDDRIRIQRRLGNMSSGAVEQGIAIAAIDEPQLAALPARGQENAVYSVVRGDGNTLVIEYPRSGSLDVKSRSVAAALLLLASVGIVFTANRRRKLAAKSALNQLFQAPLSQA